MVYRTLGFVFIPFASFAQTDSSIQYVEYEGYIALQNTADENFRMMFRSFKNSFGMEPGTSVEFKSVKKDSLFATSKVNFEQRNITAKEDTRGVIRFNVAMKADTDGVWFLAENFEHHGNDQSRFGAKNFGRLNTSTEPPRVAGISKKPRVKIWQEIKDTVDVHLKARLQEFQRQMALDF